MAYLKPLAKTYGGKYYLVSRHHLFDYFPKNYARLNYCEDFVGGGSVILNKERGAVDVINDLDVPTYHLYLAVRDNLPAFLNEVKPLVYEKRTFDEAKARECEAGGVSLAVREYVLRRMSRVGMKQAFAWSNRQRGGKPGDVNGWETALAQLPAVSERLQSVHILNCDFEWTMNAYDGPEWFHYLDPPYLPSTRVSKQVFDCEMDVPAHLRLLKCCLESKSKILLSGYANDLYEGSLRGWSRSEIGIVNHASQKKKKDIQTEVLWANYR